MIEMVGKSESREWLTAVNATFSVHFVHMVQSGPILAAKEFRP